MKIFVTGGGGFLGTHCVHALTRAGHELRLLVRDPTKARIALARNPLPDGRAAQLELVQGDIGDRAAVAQAVRGCDAALHAAAVFTFDRRRDDQLGRSVDGARNVLQLAVDAGCAPVVHVSSVVTLYPAHGVINASAPQGRGLPTGYVASKCAAEAVATELQERGAPVVTTYPGAMWGPHDPGAGEMVHLMRNIIGNRVPYRFAERAALAITDVAWAARAHAALFTTSERGPRRVTMSGRYTPWSELFATMRRVTGRRLPLFIPSPAPVTLALGRLFDALQSVVPWRMPFAHQNPWLLLHAAPTDDAAAHALAGPPPPLEHTVESAVSWAMAAGHLGSSMLTSAARLRLGARA